jgi:hypothetical protein
MTKSMVRMNVSINDCIRVYSRLTYAALTRSHVNAADLSMVLFGFYESKLQARHLSAIDAALVWCFWFDVDSDRLPLSALFVRGKALTPSPKFVDMCVQAGLHVSDDRTKDNDLQCWRSIVERIFDAYDVNKIKLESTQ